MNHFPFNPTFGLGWLAALGLVLLAGTSQATAFARTKEASLQTILNPDGTVRPGVFGSCAAKGYALCSATSAKPAFKPARTQGAGDANWSMVGGGVSSGTSSPSDVSAVALDAAGNLYVGGDFGVVGTVRARYVARWSPATATWTALNSGSGPGAFTNGTVDALVVDGSGNVYAGGTFTTIGNVAANYVAKWNGTAWSPLGSGTSGGGTSYGYVKALAVDGSGNVYAGGSFVQAGGLTVNHVAKWSPNTATWSALGAGTSSASDVRALAVDASGAVYVGGFFRTAGSLTVNGIAKWTPATSSWSALGTGLGQVGSAFSLALDGGGNLYVGGQFTSAGSLTAYDVAKWNGTSWSGLGRGVNGNGVRALTADGNGNVYVGGDISSALSAGSQSLPVIGIAKWNGTVWSALGTGLRGVVLALVRTSASGFYAGGSFASVGDNSKVLNNLAQYSSLVQATGRGQQPVGATALYPNPAHGRATVRLSAETARIPLLLLDALGREVRRYPAPTGNEATLDLRGLPAGFYVLRCGAWNQKLQVLE